MAETERENVEPADAARPPVEPRDSPDALRPGEPEGPHHKIPEDDPAAPTEDVPRPPR
ncbi:hypothetical protein [Pseudonocardia nigra]|uniref:hypothetical protein n=1 Tax=Pseudonocardia nigra TaxID=1921578 RepID=UPI001C606795|nr:hypothetical protein [Pseudonocardia nigra]